MLILRVRIKTNESPLFLFNFVNYKVRKWLMPFNEELNENDAANLESSSNL